MPTKKKEQQPMMPQRAMPMTAPDTQSVSEIGLLLNRAMEQNANIETLERVIKLYEQGQHILAKQQFHHAFAAFQSEMPKVRRSKQANFPTRNGSTMSYSYASLDDVVEAVKPVLHKFGLSYWFEQQQEGPSISVTCTVSHVSGHSINNVVTGPIDTSGNKNGIQQVSSTITYLKRIALVGILGVACTDEDLDGYSPDIPQQKASAYPEDDFQRNLPDWTTRIESGRNSVDEILTSINSKAPATPEQVQRLQSIQYKG